MAGNTRRPAANPSRVQAPGGLVSGDHETAARMASPQKIALVCDWFFPRVGGVESHLRQLGAELARRGHAVHAVTVNPGPPELDGMPVHRLPLARLPFYNVAFQFRGLPMLADLFRQERFSVVHSHSLFSPLAHGAMTVARRLGLGGVLTNHSLLRGWELPTFAGLNRFFGWSRHPAVMTGVSAAVAADTRGATGRPDVQVIPNGIDLALWRPPATGAVASDEIRVVSVMRLNCRKRPLDFVRTLALVKARARGRKVRFILVGDGPMRSLVGLEAARLGVSRELELTGYLSPSEVRRLLGQASLFALPTRTEGFGISLLEARAMGLPVVAMRQGGQAEIVTHGRHGLLAGTLAEFAGAVSELVLDDALRESMAASAREGLEPYDWSVVTERYLAAYHLARGEGGAPRCASASRSTLSLTAPLT